MTLDRVPHNPLRPVHGRLRPRSADKRHDQGQRSATGEPVSSNSSVSTSVPMAGSHAVHVVGVEYRAQRHERRRGPLSARSPERDDDACQSRCGGQSVRQQRRSVWQDERGWTLHRLQPGIRFRVPRAAVVYLRDRETGTVSCYRMRSRTLPTGPFPAFRAFIRPLFISADGRLSSVSQRSGLKRLTASPCDICWRRPADGTYDLGRGGRSRAC